MIGRSNAGMSRLQNISCFRHPSRHQEAKVRLFSAKRSSEKLKDPQGQQSASRVRLPDVQFEIVEKLQNIHKFTTTLPRMQGFLIYFLKFKKAHGRNINKF